MTVFESLLDDDHIKSELRNCIGESETSLDEARVREAFFILGTSDEPLTHAELADRLGKSVRYAQRATKVFRDRERPIIQQVKGGRYRVDLEALKDLESNKGKVRRLMGKYA